MAPASVAGAAPRAHRGREAKWTRENIIERIRRWVELYGEPPRAADWNPSSAKWSAQTYRIGRYRRGDPATGEPWPSLNAAKRPFDGSLNAAVRAAGFEPARPGPRRRGALAPERAEALEMPPDVRAVLGDAVAAAAAADRRADLADRRLERVRGRLAHVERERLAAKPERVTPAVTTKTKIVRERVVDTRAVDGARAQVERAREAADAAGAATSRAKADAAEARRMATRLAARLERAEATIAELRGRRRELERERDVAEDRALAAERVRDAARDDLAAAAAAARGAAPDRGARAAESAARRSVERAELRAARAEREYNKLASAVSGEPRRLTAAELAALRSPSPAGPAVLAAALKRLALARARSGDGSIGLAAALGEVASAAVSWQERIR